MIDIQKLISAANSLDPLPASAVRLASVVNNPESGVDEVADIVAYDQALTMSVLRMANSAASASATEVTDVRDAVMRMGGSYVLSAALGSHANRIMSQPLGSFGLSENELWKHSVRSALTIELAPKVLRKPAPAAAFASALLHDVGKLVMDRFLEPDDLEMLKRAQVEGHVDPRQAEQEILDVNHAEVGGIVAQSWSLPEEIVRGIIYHHQPELVSDPVTDLVYMANIVAHYQLPAEDEEPAPFPPLDPDVAERLEVDEEKLLQLAELVDERFDESFEQYANG